MEHSSYSALQCIILWPFQECFNSLRQNVTLTPSSNSTTAVSSVAVSEMTQMESLWNSYFNKRHSYTWSLDFELRIKLTLALFVFHQIVFLGRYIPYWICDNMKSMQKYKIQKDKKITNEQWWSCVRQMVAEQILLQLPLMFGFKDSVDKLGFDLHQIPLPSYSTIISACFFFLLIEDTCAYFLHRALHWGPLYKYIHKYHHKWTAPFGLAAEYGHPAETILLGIGFSAGPIIWRNWTGHLHVFIMFCWMAVRLITTVDTHCGYHFPWSLHNFIPIWSGADFHDKHHEKFVGNYGGSFRTWDWILGTEIKPTNKVKTL